MVYLVAAIAWVSGFLCGKFAEQWKRLPSDLYAQSRASIERAKLSEVSENTGLYSDEPAYGSALEAEFAQIRRKLVADLYRTTERAEWFKNGPLDDPRRPVS